MNSVVVVESPAKARTVGRFLGKDYDVKASMGHVRDLPDRRISVDPEDEFKAIYQPQVLANAKAFAKALANEGLNVQGDPEVSYTETHQVVVVVGYAQGCSVAKELEESNIIVNYQIKPILIFRHLF